jgi:hypothetical protein
MEQARSRLRGGYGMFQPVIGFFTLPSRPWNGRAAACGEDISPQQARRIGRSSLPVDHLRGGFPGSPQQAGHAALRSREKTRGAVW